MRSPDRTCSAGGLHKSNIITWLFQLSIIVITADLIYQIDMFDTVKLIDTRQCEHTILTALESQKLNTHNKGSESKMHTYIPWSTAQPLRYMAVAITVVLLLS
jgi:hypothetical protein